MKVLVVGPSSRKSKGGMATVINEIEEDKSLCNKYHIDIYPSYIDGSRLTVLLYSLAAFLWFCLTKRKYDIYHIHAASRGSTYRKGWYARAVKRWGGKVIFHIHGAQYMEFYEEISKLKQKKVTTILQQADSVVALSEDWKRKLDRMFGLKNCVVVENGINMEKLDSAALPPHAHQKEFAMLGRLGQRKGTYDLIDAVAEARKAVPDIMCYLAGDGEIEEVRRQTREKHLEDNIAIIGWVDCDKKLELLKQVSTVVLPSYNEGMPMSILEGMACGKAIISTTVGAIPEVITDENGFLIKPGDVPALVAALVKCSTNSEQMNDISLNNMQKIKKRYSIRIMHQKLADLYMKVSGE